jgi:soluble lytic murein transglycosylase
MSSAAARTRFSTRRGRPRRSRAAGRRRRLVAGLLVVIVGVAAAAVVAGVGPLGEAIREVTLPLRHDDIIRQQARDKGLDPALIAAVIYEESKFRDQTSHAGARGLMQITPRTAEFIAHDSGGTLFRQEDLATPQVNISYGAYYLRYLLDRYEENEELAVAAYNAGETNVDRWVRDAGGPDEFDAPGDVPFPETREYVQGVLDHRSDYREHYGDELGL